MPNRQSAPQKQKFCDTYAGSTTFAGCHCCVDPGWLSLNYDIHAEPALRPRARSTSETRRTRSLRPEACSGSASSADTIFLARRVITLEGPEEELINAVASSNGRIIATGERGEILAKWSSDSTRVHDFGDAVVVPGFVESHMHPLLWGTFAMGVDCGMDVCNGSQAEMLERLTRAARDAPPGSWIHGWNYEYSNLDAVDSDGTQRPVSREELDKAAGPSGEGRKIVIDDQSGHVQFVSSAVYETSGISVDGAPPKDPFGGTFVLDAATGKLTSQVQENARMMLKVPQRSQDDMFRAGQYATEQLLTKGITTVVDAGAGFLGKVGYAVYDELVSTTAAGLRYVLMPTTAFEAALSGKTPQSTPVLRLQGDRLQYGPQKLVSDGSIQRFTAFLNPGVDGHLYVDAALPNGKPTLEKERLEAAVLAVHLDGGQIAIHTNGDAAIDAALDAIEAALIALPRDDHRHRLEHCQLASEAQLDRIAKLGVSPSFFINHVYYWGEWHSAATVGPARAARIDPLASAAARGIRYSTHCDAPVTPPSPLFNMWVAVNRMTRSNRLLGGDQRVSPLQALRAVTIDAAYQVFSDGDRGSLREGKLCDLTVLGRDPLLQDDDSKLGLRDIPVLSTVVGANVVWSSTGAAL